MGMRIDNGEMIVCLRIGMIVCLLEDCVCNTCRRLFVVELELSSTSKIGDNDLFAIVYIL